MSAKPYGLDHWTVMPVAKVTETAQEPCFMTNHPVSTERNLDPQKTAGAAASKDTAFVPSLVSVVIAVLNAEDTLPNQLRALANQSYQGNWEVVVADNGSCDSTREVAMGFEPILPSLRIVDASARQGIAAARNVGLAAADGDLILMCDADDRVGSHWLASMVSAASTSEIVGGRLVNEADSGSAYGWYRSATEGFRAALDFLLFAPSGNLAVRSSVFGIVDGFDERFERLSDVEWSWRAQVNGFTLTFCKEAVVFRTLRSTLRPMMRVAFRQGRASMKLHRWYRDHAVRNPLLNGRAWLQLIRHLPDLVRSPARRGAELRRIAFRVGTAVEAVAGFRWRAETRLGVGEHRILEPR